MRKKLRQILIGTLLTTITFIVMLAILVLNPQILFAEKVSYRGFNIYSNNAIPDTYKTTIDYAVEVITTSEIYEPGHELDIFLCYGSFYNEIDSRLFGSDLAKSVHNNLLLKVPVDFDNNILIGWNTERNLKKTIAHEAIHFYQMNKYGMEKFSPINHPPTWKGEGYPEYVAYQKDIRSNDYSLRASIKRIKEFETLSEMAEPALQHSWKPGEYLFETEPGQFDLLVYYKGRVMIEYLIDIKGLTYTEILDEGVTEEKVVDEMTSWYEGQNE